MQSKRAGFYYMLIVLLAAGIPITTISEGHAARLLWNANRESDLAGYKVYHGTASRKYTFVMSLGKVTVLDVQELNLSEGKTYYIALTAYDFTGNESTFSSEVTFLADDLIPADADNCPTIYNPDQADTMPPWGNDIGDACECLADITCDGKVDIADLMILKQAFLAGDPDSASYHVDLNYDGKVNLIDTLILRTEYLRVDCPPCRR